MSAILLPLEITSTQRYFSILAQHSHNIERSDLRLGDKVFQLRPTKVQTEKTSGYSFIFTIIGTTRTVRDANHNKTTLPNHVLTQVL